LGKIIDFPTHRRNQRLRDGLMTASALLGPLVREGGDLAPELERMAKQLMDFAGYRSVVEWLDAPSADNHGGGGRGHDNTRSW
jgi:hypothetical protein